MKNFCSFEWLNKHLNDDNVVPIDCRFNLRNPDFGLQQYKNDHIPNARYFHLNQDLSSPVQEKGGRHPLPDLGQFSTLLGNNGITNDTIIVVYDDQNMAMAARAWWLFKYIGHEKCYVLNGGYSQWKAKGFPVTAKNPIPTVTTYTPHPVPNRIISQGEVKQSLNNKEKLILDARAPERFRGEVEPIDPVAGHIPSAQNYFWKENVMETGAIKEIERLEKRFNDIKHKHIINYCGSGVTACVNVLVLDELNIPSKLYVGSWSDWSSNKDLPIEKG